MLLTTLRYGNTVRKPAEEAYDGLDKVKIDPDLLDLASKVIDRKKGKFDPSTFEDRYEKAVLDLIKSRKKSGKKAPVRQEEEKPSNVINLFDALKKSLAAGKDGGGDDKTGREASRRPRRLRTRSRLPAGGNHDRRWTSLNPTAPSGTSSSLRSLPARRARARPRPRPRMPAASSSCTSTMRGVCTTISGSSMTACCGAGR